MRPIIGITSDVDEEVFRIKRDYVSAVVDAGGTPLIIPHCAGDAARVADTVDGLLLSGGGDLPPGYYGEGMSAVPECESYVKEERIESELALLREMMKREKPVFGICLGMQLINVALGGSLYQDIKQQIPGAFDHRKGMHGIAVAPSFLSTFDIHLSSFAVNSFHHQAVKVSGGGLQIFASADDGVVEGIWKSDYPFLVGVQWHPERDACSGFLLKPPVCDTLSLKLIETFIKKSKVTGH